MSQPGDAMEREADRVADAVLRMPEVWAPPPRLDITDAADGTIQRTADAALDEDLMVKRDGAGPQEAPVTFGAELSALSDGAPLPEPARAYFEPRFGYDFSGVRVYTGGTADAAAHSVQTRAFTLGGDIVFRAGEYAPDSQAGRRLLAHELTHVVQQSRSASAAQRVLRTPYEGCGRDVTGVDDADARIDAARAEAEALLARARGAFPRMSSRTIRLVDRHFHCPSSSDIRAIMGRLDASEAVLPSLVVRCVSGSSDPCGDHTKTRIGDDGVLEFCPVSFSPGATSYRLAVSLIWGAASTIGLESRCMRREPCYDDFTVPAADMVNNAYSYAWFAVELAGHALRQPPTIPCRPLNTGVNIFAPPDPAGIRRVTGFERPPPGAVILPVFVDQAGNYFIYHEDYPGAMPYLPGERARYYFPEGRMP